MRAVSDQSDRAYRHHASDKQMIWLAMAPSSPGGRSYRNPDHSLVDDMPSASTGVCFDKAVIIRPRAPPPGRHTRLQWAVGWSPLSLARQPPLQGDELSIGEESSPKGGTKKKIAGRKLPDGEVGAQCMF